MLLGGIDPLDASVEQLQQLEQLVGLLGVDLSAGGGPTAAAAKSGVTAAQRGAGGVAAGQRGVSAGAVGIGPGVGGGSDSRLRENVVPLEGGPCLMLSCYNEALVFLVSLTVFLRSFPICVY